MQSVALSSEVHIDAMSKAAKQAKVTDMAHI